MRIISCLGEGKRLATGVVGAEFDQSSEEPNQIKRVPPQNENLKNTKAVK